MEQAIILAERMNNQELTYQAKRNVKNVIKQIYSKSKDKFKRLQATATVDYSITKMLKELKNLVYDTKLNTSATLTIE